MMYLEESLLIFVLHGLLFLLETLQLLVEAMDFLLELLCEKGITFSFDITNYRINFRTI